MIDPCRLEYEKIIKQRPPEEKEDKEPWHKFTLRLKHICDFNLSPGERP